MNQTAVEFLEKEMHQIRLYVDKDVLKFIDKSINKAKEMEKQQIIDAWLKGVEDEGNPHGHTYFYGEIDLAKKYYKETYETE